VRLEHEWLPLDLPDYVVLGERAFLHSVYAFNHSCTEVPEAVRIGQDTALYEATMFELGPAGSVEIGRFGVVNGPSFIANSRIVIGDFAYLSYEVFFSDSGAPVPPIDSAFEPFDGADEPSIVLGDDCWIGLRSVILGGTRLGDRVIVGAGSVVQGTFPDDAIVAGNPARVMGIRKS
jgi:UDP-3-O-[3-hydroxymyristoyl] glucosamine N-acyltransferase